MTGAILQLVSIGQDNLYLTDNPSITMFKTIYRRHSNFSMQDITRKLGNLNTFGGSTNYEIEKLGDLLHQMCLMIEIPPITLEFLSPTASNIAGVMNNYRIKWDYNSDGFQNDDIITLDYYNDNIIPDIIEPYIDNLILENNNANNILQIVDYTYGVLNSENDSVGSFANVKTNIENFAILSSLLINAVNGGLFPYNAFYEYNGEFPKYTYNITAKGYAYGNSPNIDFRNIYDVIFALLLPQYPYPYPNGGVQRGSYVYKNVTYQIDAISYRLIQYLTGIGNVNMGITLATYNTGAYMEAPSIVIANRTQLSSYSNLPATETSHIFDAINNTNLTFRYLFAYGSTIDSFIGNVYINRNNYPVIQQNLVNSITKIKEFINSFFGSDGIFGILINIANAYGSMPFFINNTLTTLNAILNNIFQDVFGIITGILTAINELETNLEKLFMDIIKVNSYISQMNYSNIDNILVNKIDSLLVSISAICSTINPIINTLIGPNFGWAGGSGNNSLIYNYAIQVTGIYFSYYNGPFYNVDPYQNLYTYGPSTDYPSFITLSNDPYASTPWTLFPLYYPPSLPITMNIELNTQKLSYMYDIINNIINNLIPSKNAAQAYQTSDFLRSIFENVTIQNDTKNYNITGPYFQTIDNNLTKIGVLYRCLMAYTNDIIAIDGTGLLNTKLNNSDDIQIIMYKQYINFIIKGIVYNSFKTSIVPDYPTNISSPYPPYDYNLPFKFTNTYTQINDNGTNGQDIFYFDPNDINYSSIYDNMIFYHAINYGDYTVTEFLRGTLTIEYFNNVIKNYYGNDTSYLSLDFYYTYLSYMIAINGTSSEYLTTTNNLKIIQTNLLNNMLWNMQYNLTQFINIMNYFKNQSYESSTHFIFGYYKPYNLNNGTYNGTSSNIISLYKSSISGLNDNISSLPVTSLLNEPDGITRFFPSLISNKLLTLSIDILNLLNTPIYTNYINDYKLWQRLILTQEPMNTILTKTNNLYDFTNSNLASVASSSIGSTLLTKIAILNYIPILVVRDIPTMFANAINNNSNFTTYQKSAILADFDLRDFDQTGKTNRYATEKRSLYNTILQNVMFNVPALISTIPKLIDNKYISTIGNSYLQSDQNIIIPLIRQEPLLILPETQLDSQLPNISLLIEPIVTSITNVIDIQIENPITQNTVISTPSLTTILITTVIPITITKESITYDGIKKITTTITTDNSELALIIPMTNLIDINTSTTNTKIVHQIITTKITIFTITSTTIITDTIGTITDTITTTTTTTPITITTVTPTKTITTTITIISTPVTVIPEIENLPPINYVIESYRNLFYKILCSSNFNNNSTTAISINNNNTTIGIYLQTIIQNVCNSFNISDTSLNSYNFYVNNGYTLYPEAGTGTNVSYSDAISSIWNNIYTQSILLYNDTFNNYILSNTYYKNNIGSTMSQMYSLFQANMYNINHFNSFPIYYGPYTNKYVDPKVTTNISYLIPINADNDTIYSTITQPVTTGFDFYEIIPNNITVFDSLYTTATNLLNLFYIPAINNSSLLLQTIVGRYQNIGNILRIKYASIDNSLYKYNNANIIAYQYTLGIMVYNSTNVIYKTEINKILGNITNATSTELNNINTLNITIGTYAYIKDKCITAYDILGYNNTILPPYIYADYAEPKKSIYNQLIITNTTNNPYSIPQFQILNDNYKIYPNLEQWWENVIPTILINTSYHELSNTFWGAPGATIIDFYKSQIQLITPVTLYNAPFLGYVYNNFSTKLDVLNYVINSLISKTYDSIDLSFLNERFGDATYHIAYQNITNKFVNNITTNNDIINKIGAINQDIIPTGPQGDDIFTTPDYRYPWLSILDPIPPDIKNVIYTDKELDTILKNMILHTVPQSAWAKELGHKIIKKLTIEIDGRELDEYNPDLLSLIHKMYDTPEHESGYNKLIGNTPDMYTLSRTNKKGVTLYIPLRFWFCKDEGNSLPLCANLYSIININIELNKLDELLYREPGSILISPKKIKQKINEKSLLKIKSSLKMKYIYLDENERIKYATTKLEYLINNFKYSGLYTYGKCSELYTYRKYKIINKKVTEDYIIVNSSTIKQYLFFNNPTKYLLWTIRAVNKSNPLSSDNIINWNRCGYVIPNNDTSPNIGMTGKANIIDPKVVWDDNLPTITNTKIVWDNNLPTTTNMKIVDKMKILFDGRDREEYHDEEFYKSIQPYARCLGSLDNGQYLYSFALLPQLIQPSGSANLTYVPQLELSFTLNSKFIEYMNLHNLELELQMWACSTEILRVMSGFIAPAFTY
jgi:hypothetical protein